MTKTLGFVLALAVGAALLALAVGAALGWVGHGLVAVQTWRTGYHDGLEAADSAIHTLEHEAPRAPGGAPVWRAIVDR